MNWRINRLRWLLLPVEIFCCYARKDQLHLNDLKTHLITLQRQGQITIWADTDIDAGMEWEREIDKHLDTAQIILLLVSPDFIASEYCYGKEMTRAMARHKAGEAQVVPIILRSVLWENTPFANLQALPTGARPVISSFWHNQDEALLSVASGIQKVVQRLLNKEIQQERPGDDLSTYFKTKAVPTGFEDLDRLTGGLQSSDLIIVEAPTATGKTSFALSIALNVAIMQVHSVGIFSLEMSKQRVIQRLISLDTSIELRRLQEERLEDEEWDKYVAAMDIIRNGHILIDESAGFTVSQLRTRMHEMVQDGKVDLIIVDYVNLMQAEVTHKGYENKGQDFREVSRGLKLIARELNIPLLVLVQISRKVRSLVEEPRVSDAQDNSIENDADVVMYMYREDMFDQNTTRRNLVDILVTKHRNGPLGDICLYCHPGTGRFRDLMINTTAE